MKKTLIIVGAGGLGREVAWLVEDLNKSQPQWELLGFVDDGAAGSTVEGYPILGPVSIVFNMNTRPYVIVAIADSRVRQRMVKELGREGIELATLIHPSVMMSENVSIGDGCIICAGSVITTNVTLGTACIVNPLNFIGHDSILQEFVSLMPGVKVAGEVQIGTGSYFGLNSCVINRTSIGEWSVIGAGATVVDDIPPYSLAVGVPARVVKNIGQ